ncbi:MAG: hypothetical protein LBK67_11295 [Coriobacteriales bacterium]|nr:hypothetical protein [Coriobacteriales bacterium]
MGVVIALTLVIVLLFTTAQVYWVNSTAGDIQFAADAGALAAENLVGEYYILARVADAVVLSLSLFGMLIFGVAIVVSCIPYCQGVGAELMDFGRGVFNARDTCAKQARFALNSLQKALPFLAAANAAATISANSFSPEGVARYQGIAILVPLEGEDVSFADDAEAQASADMLEEQNQKTSGLTDEAEDARKQMERAKLEGFEADCGAEPNYCMYERAGQLAGLTGAQNPNFSSVDLWKFDYAFARAKAYYQRRFVIEISANASLDEQIRSNARRLFYAYAVEEMGKGYARTDANGVLDAYFPLLARNNEEVRKTSLYTNRVFSVDASGHIHAVSSCPGIEGGIAGSGSLSELESGIYEVCPTCNLSVRTIGSVANASTSIANGFEYHYRIVADAAERYRAASKTYREHIQKAEESASEAFDAFAEALSALDTPRLTPRPPGRNGCVVIAIDKSAHKVPRLLSNSLVEGDAVLQPRVALSAAALAEDIADGNNNILGSFLDKVKDEVDFKGTPYEVLGVFDKVLEIWGGALLYYNQGVESLVGGVGDFLREIPLVRSTPLASWAERTMREAIEAVGLQGVDMGTPKPLVVNSIHVLRSSNSAGAEGLVIAKEAYSSLPGSGSGTLQASVVDGLLLELKERGSQALESEITIFTISFGDMPGLPQIPIKLALPSTVVERGKGLLDEMLSSLSVSMGGGDGRVVWE